MCRDTSFFYKQKTAYEMRISDWISACALTICLPSGRWRGNADHYAAFFNECFIDELAQAAKIEPMSFRMQMLGGNPRLAHCLSTAAALGGWEGGIAGSGQGLACPRLAGSHIAVLGGASIDRNRQRTRKGGVWG